MGMSVRETRPGVWEVCAYLGVYDGRKRRGWATVYGKKQDALAAERDMRIRHGGGVKLNVYELTLADYLNLWLIDYVEPYKEASTLENYSYNLKRILPHVGDTMLRKLTPQDLQRAYARIGKKVSSATVRNTHRVMHAALERAVKNDLVPYNVADRVELPPAPRFAPRVLTPEEAVRLLEAAQGTQHYTLLVMALLTWQDVNLTEGVLRVRKGKTEAGQCVVCLPPPAIVVLNDLHARRSPQPTDPVFVGKTGRPICMSIMSKKYLRGITGKAGLPRMRFHDLRHTHITWLAAADISARTVADRVGHVDPGFTMRTYAHLSTDAQRRAAVLVGNTLRLPENLEKQTGC